MQAQAVLRVKGTPDDVARARMLLLDQARTVLGNGLRLLGLNPLDNV